MQVLQVSKSTYYSKPTILSDRDAIAVAELKEAHNQHPFYGVARLAIHLNWSHNKTRRIRNLAEIVVPTASKRYRYPRRAQAEINAPSNMLHKYAVFKDERRPQDGMDYSDMVNAEAWVQDFSYLRHNNSFCYLAVVMSLKTRQVVGWRLGTNHTSELTHSALLDALSKHDSPRILHSDQGSEYLSYKHQLLCERFEIALSVSNKSSPWQNGFMERWFNSFKLEFGKPTNYKDLAGLHEAIAIYIHYYNTKRIHTALKTTPTAYAKALDEVSRKKVG